jgi:hypothetical protein
MVLCVLLAATAAMPAGGTLTGTATPEGGFTFTMAGRNAAWPAAIEEPVTADLMRGPQDARNLALPMARLVAAGLGWRLAVSDDQLSATPPMADEQRAEQSRARIGFGCGSAWHAEGFAGIVPSRTGAAHHAQVLM